MAPLTLYSELLLNIKQITILAVLSSPSNKSTKVRLSGSRTDLFLHHDSRLAVLRLPCQVSDNHLLKVPDVPYRELSFRLSVDDSSAFAEHQENDPATSIWPASSLGHRTLLACRSCAYVFVDGRISSWRDLPSENWAEMMDFWHCHKPDIKSSEYDSDIVGSKGYAAGRRIAAQPGVAFVDSLHFQIHQQDCIGLEVSRFLIGSYRHPKDSIYHDTVAERKRLAPFIWIYFAVPTIQMPKNNMQHHDKLLYSEASV